jgi:(E)-4-hydroxy-3-methyl-but-2-enyl pyrophosphate reductase
LAYVTQTTLSVDDAAAIVAALKRRFPRIVGPKRDDICYATQNRQDAVKFMAKEADVVIVVGSPNSSNSNRLREVAANRGVAAYMIDRAAQLKPEWIAGSPSSASRPALRPRGAGRRSSRGLPSWVRAASASSTVSPSASCSRCRKA